MNPSHLWVLVQLVSARIVVEFSRALNTCDNQDLEIQSEGTTRVVYSSNEAVPNPDPTYHTKRGTQSIRLSSPGESTFDPPETDVSYLDLKFSSYKVPFGDPSTGNDTTYFCGGFKIPPPSEKIHIVRFEPIISPASNLGTVHHILVFECAAPETLDGVRSHCYNGKLPDQLSRCNGGTVIGAWAIGGVGFSYPDHTGYPVTPDSGPRMVLMEIHYNNPTLKEVIDESGMRFYYTRQLRKHDAGILGVGHFTDSLWSIPPRQESYKVTSWCPGICTSRMPGPINLVGTLLHAHLAGRRIRFGLIRNGKELAPILADQNYDFNFQDFEAFPQEIQIFPNDTLYSVCEYNTMDRKGPTYFGLSTHNEMCLTYSVYYPRLPGTATCASGNYSSTPYPEYGTGVACGDDFFPKVEIKPYTPYAPRNCTHVPPPANRTTPKVGPINAFNPSLYKYNTYLDDQQQYKLHWTPDLGRSEIHFAAEVNTTGWVGFGISPNGGMVGSDVSISWIDGSGRPQHADRFAVSKTLPIVDTFQDHYDITIRKG